MTFIESMQGVDVLFEGMGALVLLGGLLVSIFLAVRSFRSSSDGRKASMGATGVVWRVHLARRGDTRRGGSRRTVAVAPTMDNVATLGLIVLIRTVLSFSLEIEVEGVLRRRAGPAISRELSQRSRDDT